MGANNEYCIVSTISGQGSLGWNYNKSNSLITIEEDDDLSIMYTPNIIFDLPRYTKSPVDIRKSLSPPPLTREFIPIGSIDSESEREEEGDVILVSAVWTHTPSTCFLIK